MPYKLADKVRLDENVCFWMDLFLEMKYNEYSSNAKLRPNKTTISIITIFI